MFNSLVATTVEGQASTCPNASLMSKAPGTARLCSTTDCAWNSRAAPPAVTLPRRFHQQWQTYH